LAIISATAADDGLRTALIGAAATLLSASLGFGGIIWQIGRQGRDAIRQQRESERLKLNLKIYESAIALIQDGILAEVSLASVLQGFPPEMNTIGILQAGGIGWNPPAMRYQHYADAKARLSAATISIIQWVEQWETVDPRFKVFQTAVNVASHEIQDATENWFKEALPCMPVERVPGELFPWSLPDAQKRARLEQLREEVNVATGRLGCWLHDFRVELQAALLGELFSGKVERREPIDPRFFAVRLDRADELTRHFETETTWARVKERAIADARAALAAAARSSPTTSS